jgi:hypothetical protein
VYDFIRRKNKIPKNCPQFCNFAQNLNSIS